MTVAEPQAHHLTLVRERLVLAALDDQGGRAKPGRLAAVLQTTIPVITAWLEELAERGVVRRVQTRLHVEWERVNWVVDHNLVCEAYMPRITALLVGRRELASRIAQELGLPRAEVEETCRAMMLAGQLVGTPIQATYVYGLPARGEARVDWAVVARVEGSPEAVFQRGLAQRLQEWSRPGLPAKTARAEANEERVSAWPCPAPAPLVLTRARVTLAVEEQLRELLPARQRRRPGGDGPGGGTVWVERAPSVSGAGPHSGGRGLDMKGRAAVLVQNGVRCIQEAPAMTVALHRSTLPDTERQRRQKAVNTARASVRLEGFVLDEVVEGLYAQYVCGELELAEVMAQVQQYARRSA